MEEAFLKEVVRLVKAKAELLRHNVYVTAKYVTMTFKGSMVTLDVDVYDDLTVRVSLAEPDPYTSHAESTFDLRDPDCIEKVVERCLELGDQ